MSVSSERTGKGDIVGCTTGVPSFTPGQSGPLDRRNRLPRVGTPGAFGVLPMTRCVRLRSLPKRRVILVLMASIGL